MLTFSDLKTLLNQLIGTTGSSSRTDIKTAVRFAILAGQQRFCLHGDWSFLNQYQDFVYIPLAAPYETGTVTVTQDSKTVTGSGTAWTDDMEGSFFRLTNLEAYEIRSVESATSLTLAIPYQNSSDSAETYEILKRFYPLPLDFLKPIGKSAKLQSIGNSGESEIYYDEGAGFDYGFDQGQPTKFCMIGNTRTVDYYTTGTVTVATSGGVSTWTVSTGTLPTDSVDREVRIAGEDRSYRIKTRSGATTFITYDVYVNPSDGTNTQSTASNWAMTPKSTMLVGFNPIADDRYIFKMPYIKRLQELIADNDVSPIAAAGYDRALLACCKAELAKNARMAVKGDLIEPLMSDAENALAEAWAREIDIQNSKERARGSRVDRSVVGPSWLA